MTGRNNNLSNPSWGSSETPLLRSVSVDFADGKASPSGETRINPREISNILFEQSDQEYDPSGRSDYVWVFGQFIQHDISRVEEFERNQNPDEIMDIIPPLTDKFFLPSEKIPMMRSMPVEGTGLSVNWPRQYRNKTSSYIDASMIYSADPNRTQWLRTFTNGKLILTQDNQLPWNTLNKEFNSSIDSEAPVMKKLEIGERKYFVTGDERANENPMLLSLYTLFAREHNRWCDILKDSNPLWNDEKLFQEARRRVYSILQAIVYYEWLPALGIDIPEYSGYKKNVNPTVSNVFDVCVMKFDKSLSNDAIVKMNNDGSLLGTGTTPMREAYYNPLTINFAGGIDPFLKGMATNPQQNLDCKIIDDLRNFKFSDREGGLDMVALTINRARDRGLPDYNTVRSDIGLPKVSDFDEICSDQNVSILLEEIYESIDNIDPWVGMLAEDHVEDMAFGELLVRLIERQFKSLRDGDRFYFENDSALSEDEINEIKSTRLYDIIYRNSNVKTIQKNVFFAMPHEDIPQGPEIEMVEMDAAVYPVPFQSEMILKCWSDKVQNALVEVYDQHSCLVFNQQLQLEKGMNYHSVSIGNNIPDGTYHIVVSNEDYKNYSILRTYKHR